MFPKSRLTDLIQRFPSSRVLVLGDIILDIYLECRALGIANEAPVPLLEVLQEKQSLGGAANVAHNLAKLGVATKLIGMVGEDAGAQDLSNLLAASGVAFLPLVTQRQTIRKTRVLSGSQYYLRIDEESPVPLEGDEQKQLLDRVEQALPGTQVVVISDYDKGLVTAESARELEALFQQHGVKVLADLKPKNAVHWQHLDVLTPNISEARAICSLLGADNGRSMDDSDLAKKLSQLLKCEIVLKRASKGLLVASRNQEVASYPALCQRPLSTSGAGDTVLAVLAASLACGSSLEEAAYLSSHAAAIAVSNEGTYAVSASELTEVC